MISGNQVKTVIEILKDKKGGNFQMNIYKTVKEAVSTSDAASFYGIQVNRNGMCCCPFHSDRNPSMKVDINYYCFGCGEKGDVISFVSKLFNISPYESTIKLSKDFGINISQIQNIPVSNKNEIYTKRKEVSDFKKALSEYIFDSITELLAYLNSLKSFLKDYNPTNPDEFSNCNPLYEEALNNIDRIEWMLDQLTFEDTNSQIEFINTYKGEIENVRKRNIELNTNKTINANS